MKLYILFQHQIPLSDGDAAAPPELRGNLVGEDFSCLK